MTTRVRRRGPGGSLVGLAIALMVAVGCMAGGAPDPANAPAPEQSRRSATAGVEGTRADGTDTVEEFQQDLADARSVAERYWAAQFRASGQRFQPVRRIIPYQRSGEVACGGQEIPRNNAVYCAAGDYIAYDVNWSFGAFRQIGDAFVFYLLGHEYAHGIQTRLGIHYTFTIQQELQADCMAGAFLGDSVRSKALRLDDGDLAEFREGLLAVGDDPNQPWFAEDSHGTAQQRTAAFFRGYEQSLDACDLT
ncbi:neutral zinc metallopeptidase [Micromonospora sp. WMMA1363]|uniref:neutral zinc metallopeptidase n=1 Tax=Micromonospora sp. WMMA1363 TaxID=3053985 RepID=UPI00259C852B|nr:neutral zinc metallopeptidase [Micromonospora sp. WMMA1363]MDM4718913.1 neutral zinc metallopeptidase [Micromonospora sp. WMMA1363]